jgi:hypothetical protein
MGDGFTCRTVKRVGWLALLILALGPVRHASAQNATDSFYKGKVVTIYVYTPASGTSYDLTARLLARYLPAHLPGEPTVIVKNMPGGGGLTLTRYLYSVAPKDGTAFGTIPRSMPFESLLGSEMLDFDPLKFTWLGSPAAESSVAIAWHTAPVKTAHDLLEKELLVGGTGASADSELIPKALNGLVGTKFKVIPGYAGVAMSSNAMEQGETEGIAYWSWSAVKAAKADWLRDKKINILFQTGRTANPDIPNVPLAMTFAKTERQRQALSLLFARDALAFPYVAPPDLPADRAKILKQAFLDGFNDPTLAEDARKVTFQVGPVSADQAEEIMHQAFATPPEVIKDVRTALGR